VKVGDFGIAKAAFTNATGVGVLKGRSPYMAPGQCLGQPVDRRSDVFALGIVLWEMSTMHRLYKGKDRPRGHADHHHVDARRADVGCSRTFQTSSS